jgi:inner membrane protein
MDSITQAALGAAIGEATLGRKVGNKALLWGAVVGTLADLDVIFTPWLDEVTKLSWHRGYSHSLFFNLLAAPIVGWLLSQLHKDGARTRDWIAMAFWVMFPAILLDAFVVYGTQLLLPFSDYPVGFNTISVVDPLFTLPLLIGIVGALFLNRNPEFRYRFNLTGLVVAVTYLAITVGAKVHVNQVAERAFASEQIVPIRYMSAPTLFNGVLWRVMAEVEDGYYAGHYSLLDRTQDISLYFIPRRDSLLDGLDGERAIRKLKWFSQGYYEVAQTDFGLRVTDLRFGELLADLSLPRTYIFKWDLIPSGRQAPDSLTLRPSAGIEGDPAIALQVLWDRALGK